MPKPQRLPSSLAKKRWLVRDRGLFRVADVTSPLVDAIDDQWPSLRRPTDWHHEWRWRQLTEGKREVFAVVNDSGEPAGIWCSGKREPIKLEGGRFYRLDYLELSPELRGGDMGVFLFLLISARAVEVDADGILLATWPLHRKFYSDLGGLEGPIRGWNLEPNLVPFKFDREALVGFQSALERLEQHAKNSPNF